MNFTKTYYTVNEVLKLYPKTSKDFVSEVSKPSIPVNSPNLNWKCWEQSYKAAKQTLQYIDRLKTKVYILIIENNQFKDFIKFNPKGENLELKPYLRRLNKTIKWSKKELQEISKTKWKFMSCILQNRKDEDEIERHPFHTPLQELAEKYKLPDGMYIFNLRDALLIHKKEIFPWTQVTGKMVKMINFPKSFLPVFNTTGGKYYRDIPIPNFEDRYYIFKNKPDLKDINLNWESKVPTAVFRGGTSGCGYDEYTNPRIKIAKLSQILQDEKNEEIRTLLDAGVTKIPLKKKYRFDFKEGLGYFNNEVTQIKPVKPLNKVEQSNYKYIVYIEGNVAAHRLLVDMLLGSTILYVDTEYKLWFEHLLEENIHYVKVKRDLSDLIQKILWCRENDELCKNIAKNARELALSLLTKEVFIDTFANYIMSF